MKKIAIAAGLLALSLSLPVHAEESKAGGLEFSGNVSIVTGWQHDDSAALPTLGGEFDLMRGFRAPSRDTFNFYLDQFELDLDKSFGDKIRLRADLDFGRALSGSTRTTVEVPLGSPAFALSNFMVEQAYVTLGAIGGEFAIGRFNAPVGYYVVDRAFNPTISFSNIYLYLTPTNVTGAKMYWAFGDHYDLSVYLMNQMFDCLQVGGTCLVGPNTGPFTADSAVPSWGMRFGFNWGEGETKSTLGIAYLGGPEQGTNDHFDYLIDLDFSIKATENLLIAGEGIYYQRNNLPSFTGFPNAKFAGGLLLLDYALSDIWDIFFSYGYVHDFHGRITGADMQVHNFVLGAGYQITDGAKMKLEYRADLYLYASTQGPTTLLGGATAVAPGGTSVLLADTTSMSHAVAAEFAYNW